MAIERRRGSIIKLEMRPKKFNHPDGYSEAATAHEKRIYFAEERTEEGVERIFASLEGGKNIIIRDGTGQKNKPRSNNHERVPENENNEENIIHFPVDDIELTNEMEEPLEDSQKTTV